VTDRHPSTLVLIVGALVLISALSMAGCSDNVLQITSDGLRDMAVAMNGIQTTAINAESQGLISEDDAAKFLILCDRINTAGQQATAIVKGQAKLDPSQRGSIHTILVPIVSAVQDATKNGVVTISNDGVRRALIVYLTTIQTALSSIDAVLAVKG
jgi:hypothetical protein